MTLIGRDQEIAALNTLLRDCARGKGGVAVIRGPVAIGKTAVLRAFADHAAATDAIFLGAVASRAERGLPLGVLDQLCRGSSLPVTMASRAIELVENHTLGEPEPGTVSPVLARLSEGLLELLVELSEDVPVVLAVDDMQYADVVSLQCLSYVARRAATARILTVLTECAHTLPADRLLRAEILRQGNGHCIPVAPLPPSSVATLLTEYLDPAAARRLAPSCRAMTGGSPLLVNALAHDTRVSAGQSPAELVPGAAFRSAVVTCLHRYEPAMVELGQAVALLDADATPSLLGDLLALSPESVAGGMDALDGSGLLEAGRFRHEQARQAVLNDMTADERAAMHGSATRRLHQAGAAPMTLAGHIMAAHRLGTRWAVATLEKAAEQALADGEAGRAIEYLRRAERECVDERQRATVIFALTCAEWSIDPECAARHLPQLVADARAGLLDRECLGKLAYYLLWMGDTASAAEILTSLETRFTDAACGPAGPAAHHLTIRSPRDFLYPDLARRARETVREARGSAQATTVAGPRGIDPPPPAAGNGGRPALIVAERILSEGSLNDPTLASIATALLALVCEGMLDRAASWCDMLLRESEAAGGGPLCRALLSAFWAMIETRRGNLPAAEDHARTALTSLTAKAWGVAIGGPLSSLLLTATASRKHEAAAAYLRMPVPEAMFGTLYGLLYLYARGEYYLSTGCPQAALADFSECGSRMEIWQLDLPGLIPWRAKAAEAYLAMGNSLKARELSKEQLAQAGPGFSRTRGIALRALALSSHPSERTALLRESAEVLRDSGARLELAYTFVELSNSYLALGEHGRARWAARRARSLAESCGVQAAENAAGKADFGREETGSGVGAQLLGRLSDAEQRVAMLAAYGYTNGQIANKLYITVSTVEQHLTRVYRKLGVAGRTELPIEI